MARLDHTDVGDDVIVTALRTAQAPGLARRLMALGFAPGTRVTVTRRAPMGDPTEYHVRGGRISLRRRDAAMIEITYADSSHTAAEDSFHHVD